MSKFKVVLVSSFFVDERELKHLTFYNVVLNKDNGPVIGKIVETADFNNINYDEFDWMSKVAKSTVGYNLFNEEITSSGDVEKDAATIYEDCRLRYHQPKN